MLFNVLRKAIIFNAVRKGEAFCKLQTIHSSGISRTCFNRPMLVKTARVLPINQITPLDLSELVQKSLVLDNPISKNITIKEIPNNTLVHYIDDINLQMTIEEPLKIIEKQAARLIVIRRKKMKKHKLKKLRKKMKFEWAKVRQRRELKKEKAFQAELMGKIRESEKFNPVVYAAEKIRKANEVIPPWEDKPLLEANYIKQVFEEREARKLKKLEKIERKKKMNLKVSDYNV